VKTSLAHMSPGDCFTLNNFLRLYWRRLRLHHNDDLLRRSGGRRRFIVVLLVVFTSAARAAHAAREDTPQLETALAERRAARAARARCHAALAYAAHLVRLLELLIRIKSKKYFDWITSELEREASAIL